MNDDADLLRRYADEGNEAAFTALVHRHVDLVYGTALRRTSGDPHAAADVAQEVFTKLAREARRLSRHTVLPAWLHTATRNAALNLVIAEQRRKTRETEALAMQHAASDSVAPDWEQLRPAIDAAIDELPERDRAVVVLRFLDRQQFAEIGRMLNCSEDAARMRTDRALEKLRGALERRGITSPAAAIAAIVAAQPVTSAPAGLAASLAAQSLTAAAGALGLFPTLSSLMSLSTVTAVAASAVLAFGAGAYIGISRTFDTPPPPLETPRQSEMIGALRRENLALQAEVGRLNADVHRLTSANAELTRARSAAEATPAQDLRARSIQAAMLNNLRQIAAARDQFALENKRPPYSLDELVGETKYIRRLLPVDGESYLGLSLAAGQPMTVTTPSGITATYNPSAWSFKPASEMTPEMKRLAELKKQLLPAIEQAVKAYRAANDNQQPTRAEALLPYFATPQAGADFVEYLEAQKTVGR